MATQGEALIAPPTGAVIAHIDPKTEQTNYAFPLQTKAWLALQTAVAQAMQLPFDQADFVDKYGTFADETIIESAMTVFDRINTTAKEYGDPTKLISEISNFQQSKNPPDAIYGHAVWLAFQTQTTAQQISALLQEGLNDIGQESDPKVRLKDLTELLTGQGGITDQANSLTGEITTFSTKLSSFYKTLNAELAGKTDSLKSYLDQEGNVLDAANAALVTEKGDLGKMLDLVKKYNDEYIGFTVAASVAPLLSVVPPLFFFFAVGDAAIFGPLAAKAKEALDNERKLVADEKDEIKHKKALVAQVTALNGAAEQVNTNGAEFLNTLSQMVGGWTEFTTQVGLRLKSLTEDDVKEWSKFLQKINFKAGLQGWNTIANKAEDFALKGMVTFKTYSDA